MKTSLLIALVGFIYLTNAAPTDDLNKISYSSKNDHSNSYGEGEGEGKQGIYEHEIRYQKKYGEEEAYKRTYGYGKNILLKKKNKSEVIKKFFFKRQRDK